MKAASVRIGGMGYPMNVFAHEMGSWWFVGSEVAFEYLAWWKVRSLGCGMLVMYLGGVVWVC